MWCPYEFEKLTIKRSEDIDRFYILDLSAQQNLLSWHILNEFMTLLRKLPSCSLEERMRLLENFSGKIIQYQKELLADHARYFQESNQNGPLPLSTQKRFLTNFQTVMEEWFRSYLEGELPDPGSLTHQNRLELEEALKQVQEKLSLVIDRIKKISYQLAHFEEESQEASMAHLENHFTHKTNAVDSPLIQELHLLTQRGEEAPILAYLDRPNVKSQKQQLINTIAADGLNALHRACLYGHLKMVRLLLAHGADPSIKTHKNEEGYFPVHLAVVSYKKPQNSVPILQELLNVWTIRLRREAREFAQLAGRYSRTPLHTAAYYNRCEGAEWLMQQGALVDSQSFEGLGRAVTPLCTAVENNRLEMTEFLLSHGANPRFESKTVSDREISETPLGAALFFQHLEIISTLLNRGIWVTGPELNRIRQGRRYRESAARDQLIKTIQFSFDRQRSPLFSPQPERVEDHSPSQAAEVHSEELPVYQDPFFQELHRRLLSPESNGTVFQEALSELESRIKSLADTRDETFKERMQLLGDFNQWVNAILNNPFLSLRYLNEKLLSIHFDEVYSALLRLWMITEIVRIVMTIPVKHAFRETLEDTLLKQIPFYECAETLFLLSKRLSRLIPPDFPDEHKQRLEDIFNISRKRCINCAIQDQLEKLNRYEPSRILEPLTCLCQLMEWGGFDSRKIEQESMASISFGAIALNDILVEEPEKIILALGGRGGIITMDRHQNMPEEALIRLVKLYHTAMDLTVIRWILIQDQVSQDIDSRRQGISVPPETEAERRLKNWPFSEDDVNHWEEAVEAMMTQHREKDSYPTLSAHLHAIKAGLHLLPKRKKNWSEQASGCAEYLVNPLEFFDVLKKIISLFIDYRGKEHSTACYVSLFWFRHWFRIIKQTNPYRKKAMLSMMKTVQKQLYTERKRMKWYFNYVMVESLIDIIGDPNSDERIRRQAFSSGYRLTKKDRFLGLLDFCRYPREYEDKKKRIFHLAQQACSQLEKNHLAEISAWSAGQLVRNSSSAQLPVRPSRRETTQPKAPLSELQPLFQRPLPIYSLECYDSGGLTSLQRACLYPSLDIVDDLLQLQADPTIPSVAGYDAVHYVLASTAIQQASVIPPGTLRNILDRLYGQQPDDAHRKNMICQPRGPLKRTPLHFAALFGNQEGVDWLMHQGADINATESDGKTTPLESAVLNGHAPIVALLLENYLPQIAPTTIERSLEKAILGQRENIIELFLDHGLWINQENIQALQRYYPVHSESLHLFLQKTFQGYLLRQIEKQPPLPGDQANASYEEGMARSSSVLSFHSLFEPPKEKQTPSPPASSSNAPSASI